MIMYHGTILDKFESIKKDGLKGPVYLSTELKTAEDYSFNNSPDIVVFEIDIDEDLFRADPEFVKFGGNDFQDEEDPILAESLYNGSVWVAENIPIDDAKIFIYEDYELIDE